MIELEQLSVERDGEVVVRDVTVQVDRGEALAVIGPNGSGKSTLLAGLRRRLPIRGRSVVDGQSLSDLDRSTIAKIISVVPQRMEFAFPYRVEEMVLFGRAPYRRRVDTLSGGERRKVFLARALAQATPIMLLDEPTAGLDPAAQEEFVRLIDELRSDAAMALIVVLHDVRLSQRIGDYVIGLRGGDVRFNGPPSDVLDVGALRDLYGVEWTGVGDHSDGPIFLPGLDGEER